MFFSHALSLSLAIATFSVLVSAHTELWYPPWRDDTLNPPYDEQIYPCMSQLQRSKSYADKLPCIIGAGTVSNATTPRTAWPLDGGSLNITLRDGAALIFVNLGLGVNVTNFNITIPNFPLNETGAGNVCFPKLTLPSGLPISEGTQATIQVATSNPKSGEGLYTVSIHLVHSNRELLLKAFSLK
jgi:hypothetical protein